MEWIKIDKLGKFAPTEDEFLLMDEYGFIYVGTTCFDYYDSEYWCPLPKPPMNAYITNDKWIELVLKTKGNYDRHY